MCNCTSGNLERVQPCGLPRNDGRSVDMLPTVVARIPAASIMIAALDDIELLTFALAGYPINQTVLA
jgi:hypothetical protein